jgi:RNA polymerase sigma-70 factor, ECF subfamily
MTGWTLHGTPESAVAGCGCFAAARGLRCPRSRRPPVRGSLSVGNRRADRKFAQLVNRPRWACNREEMDDDGLVARVADGDDAALRDLYSRHAPWLAGRLRAVLPAAEVEDVLQETFLAVWRGARGYQAKGSAGGWIWGIARRQAALWLRRRGSAELLLPALIAADGGNLGDPAEAVLSRAELAAAVAALGPKGAPVRETWRLVYVEDRTIAEVAQLMGVPEGTVKSRAHRGRRLMRAALRHTKAVGDGGEQ